MVSAIIVAAGKGTRMGPNVDKLLLQVNSEPVVAHTWRVFDALPQLTEIILVIRNEMEPAFSEIAENHGFTKPFRFVAGGKERQDSVWNGLEALSPQCEIVIIQDGARPCTGRELIANTLDAAVTYGAAVAAQAITDTVKESADGSMVTGTLDRSRLFSVQTPQTFRVPIIRRALSEVRHRGLSVTDDTAACELIGQPVKLVLSSRPNPKVTKPEDLSYVGFLLRSEQPKSP